MRLAMSTCTLLVMLLASLMNAHAENTPLLFKSLKSGDEALIFKHATKDKVNVEYSGITPLVLAAIGFKDEKKSLRIMKLLLDRGADPNAYSKKLEGSISDMMTVIARMATNEEKKKAVYKQTLNKLALLTQYGGIGDPDRMTVVEKHMRAYRKKAFQAACSADLRNWQIEQEVSYTDYQKYPRTVQKLADTLKVISYSSDGQSFKIKVSCKKNPNGKKFYASSHEPFFEER